MGRSVTTTGLTLWSPLLRYPESSVLRAVSSSFLSLLLLVTLMWGGCISCPQFFMVPKAEKSCCDEAGKCKRQRRRLLYKRSVSGCRLSRRQWVARIIRLPLQSFRHQSPEVLPLPDRQSGLNASGVIAARAFAPRPSSSKRYVPDLTLSFSLRVAERERRRVLARMLRLPQRFRNRSERRGR